MFNDERLNSYFGLIRESFLDRARIASRKSQRQFHWTVLFSGKDLAPDDQLPEGYEAKLRTRMGVDFGASGRRYKCPVSQ